MKKLTILISLLFIFTSTFAQMGKVKSAYASYKNGNITKAKKLIDEATIHQKSMDDVLTWVFRGEIYISIVNDMTGMLSIDDEALPKAIEAYKRAKELDKMSEYPEQINSGFVAVAAAKYNLAIKEYNAAIYDKAGDLFSEAYAYAQMGNRIDTNSVFNSAVAYNLAQNQEKSIEWYGKLVDMRFDNASIYSEYANMLASAEQTEKAFEAINVGKEMYPEDFSLIIAESNLYLKTNDTDKALASLELAQSMKKDNYSIYHAIGTMYNMMFADTEKSEEERMESFEKAVEAYKKAIELNPTYFDSVYNLGAIIFNKGAYYLGLADALPFGDKAYDGLKEKGDASLIEALPFLENALGLQPNDRSTLYSLKQIYSRTGKTDQYNEVDDKLKELDEVQ